MATSFHGLRTRGVRVLLMAGAILAATSSSSVGVSAVGEQPADDAEQVRSRVVTAEAPCSDGAWVTLGLRTVRDDSSDRILVEMRSGAPDQRWRVVYRDMVSDSGEVLTTRLRSDQDGTWRLRDRLGERGRHNLDVFARSAHGQSCRVGLNAPGFPLR